MSNTDEPDRKPPQEPLREPAREPPADPNATVVFTADDVARLKERSAADESPGQEADRLVGTLIRDRWRVLARIGAGSFGTVYKVEDVKGGWVEALKILGVDRLTGAEAEEMRARFLREAQIMKRLGKDSKHIVGLSTYEEDIEAGLVYFLMEFVEGRSLADALAREGPFSLERTVHLALQVCEALMVAHEGPEPVVHRDLKLENLMLTRDRAGEEMIKVLDFGIAKIAAREADSRLTTVGTLGTPGYAAPEQLRAEEVDGRTDLFAFGVILYALLTGRDPWLGNPAHEPTNQIYELMVAAERGEVRPLAAAGRPVGPEMTQVVMRLLRRDPAERFQSARILRDTLVRIQAGGPPRATGASRGVHRPTAEAVATGPGPIESVSSATGAGATTVARPPSAARRRSAARSAPAPRPVRRKKRRGGRFAMLVLVIAAAGATGWARPWGRMLDSEAMLSGVRAGSISEVWFTQRGVEGGIQLLPVAELAEVRVPFSVEVPDDERVGLVRSLREAGATVDVAWEVRRLLDLAAEAQRRARYFGADGSDVRTYALELADVDPESLEAASLLRKVGERMAWDAAVARVEGPEGRAEELIAECLELVARHPRCLELAEATP